MHYSWEIIDLANARLMGNIQLWLLLEVFIIQLISLGHTVHMYAPRPHRRDIYVHVCITQLPNRISLHGHAKLPGQAPTQTAILSHDYTVVM